MTLSRHAEMTATTLARSRVALSPYRGQWGAPVCHSNIIVLHVKVCDCQCQKDARAVPLGKKHS